MQIADQISLIFFLFRLIYVIGNTTGPSVHKYSVASHQAQVCSQFLLFFVTPDVLLGAIFPPTAPLLYACTPLSPPFSIVQCTKVRYDEILSVNPIPTRLCHVTRPCLIVCLLVSINNPFLFALVANNCRLSSHSVISVKVHIF